MFRTLLAVVGLLLLAGCAKPVVDTTGPLAIRRVDIEASPSLRSHTDVLSLVQQTLNSQLVGTHQGRTTDLDVTLTALTYKNPLMSLLVGDANKLAATVVARDESGAELARLDLVALDGGAVNGIVGAVVSAAQDKARVDRALARELASQVERRIYGKTSRKVMTPELAPRTAPVAPPARTVPAARPAPAGAGV